MHPERSLSGISSPLLQRLLSAAAAHEVCSNNETHTAPAAMLCDVTSLLHAVLDFWQQFRAHHRHILRAATASLPYMILIPSIVCCRFPRLHGICCL